MLRSLCIRNLAIIDRLDLSFGSGLNVLTGETGAGKSIILDALNLILGGRGGSELVRAGTERATVDAVFDLSHAPSIRAFTTAAEIELEDDELFISRELSAQGKSTVKIAGRPATVSQLKELGEWLVDLHGQHEHQSLLSASKHLDILDEWSGPEVSHLRQAVAAEFQKRTRLLREKSELEQNGRERAHLLDLYTFQVNEIDLAGLIVGEEEEIAAETRRFANAEKLTRSVTTVTNTLHNEESKSAMELLSVAVRALDEAALVDTALVPIADRLQSAFVELEEVSRDLSHYVDSVEDNPERLAELQDRMDLILGLKRKYGSTIEEILTYRDETDRKRNNLENSETRLAEIESAIEKSTRELTTLCGKLTSLRTVAAKRFTEETLRELSQLAMERTRFAVQIEPVEPNSKGGDKIEFLLAPNPGEPLKPLTKIASGGEISRVMLAIKSALARQEPLPTMVFDEIDVGVGGRTAAVIAEKLATLGKSAQVICITHLGHIASRADHHFYIEKNITNDRTRVTVSLLSPEDRVDEIVRMLGGDGQSETVRLHATEMLNRK